MKWFFTRHDSNSCVANALSSFLTSPPQQLQRIKTTFRSTFRILVNKFLASKRFQWHKDVQIFSGCDSSFDLNGCNMQKCVSRCTCWRTAIHVKNATFYCVALVCRSLLGYKEERKDKSTTFTGNRIINNTWISFFVPFLSKEFGFRARISFGYASSFF